MTKEETTAYNKAYQQSHKIEIETRKKSYRQAHKSEEIARSKAYRLSHRPEIAARRLLHKIGRALTAAAWREAHKDEILAYRKAHAAGRAIYWATWRITHRAEVAVNQKRYKVAHPDKILDKLARHRARKRGVTIEKVSRAVVYERDAGRCHLCGKKTPKRGWHLDHIIPLARGGEHSYKNLAVACPECNIAKGAKGGAQLRLF